MKAGPHDVTRGVPQAARRSGKPTRAWSGSSVRNYLTGVVGEPSQMIYQPYVDRRHDHRTAGRDRPHRRPGGRTATRRAAARSSLCRPAKPADETPCARRILSTLARRAYPAARRPTADVQPLLAFYHAGPRRRRLRGGHRGGAAPRCSSAPSSCSASSAIRPTSRRGTTYRISDLELASRLSFFLWSSIPDDELLDAGRAGQAAATPAVLEQQVRRMLADPRSRRARRQLRRPVAAAAQPRGAASRSGRSFPTSTTACARRFRRETELFFDSILREDRSVARAADGGLHVRQRAARAALRHSRTCTASHFRRVTLADRQPRAACSGTAAS